MESVQPFGVDIDLVEGVMRQHDRVVTRKASDMRGYYVDQPALERLIEEQNDPLHYEVFEKDIPEQSGQLVSEHRLAMGAGAAKLSAVDSVSHLGLRVLQIEVHAEPEAQDLELRTDLFQ